MRVGVEKLDVPELSQISKANLISVMIQVSLDQNSVLMEEVARLRDEVYELKQLELRRKMIPQKPKSWLSKLIARVAHA